MKQLGITGASGTRGWLVAIEELLEFPCDHTFKVFGPNDDDFVVAVRAAVSRVTPVAFDAMKVRPSGRGNHQSVSVLVRLHDVRQLQEIYLSLRGVPRVTYLL